MKILFAQFILLAIFHLQTVKAGGDSVGSPSPSFNFNTEICFFTYSWRGRNFCAIDQLKSYDEAEAMCVANGMKLLLIHNAEGMAKFLEVVNERGKNVDSKTVWLNGKRTESGWVTFPPTEPLTSSLTSNGQLDGPGDCLQTIKTSQFESFYFSAQDCSVPQIFACEQLP